MDELDMRSSNEEASEAEYREAMDYAAFEASEASRYYTRMFWVMCDLCPLEEYGTEYTFRKNGWEFSKSGVFCPNHD